MTTPTHTEQTAALVAGFCVEAGVRQVDLSSLLGLSPASVSDRMRGQTPFTVTEIALIATLLDVDTGDLIAPIVSAPMASRR